MKHPRWPLFFTLALLGLLLGGCINIQQEYWLKADGSAQVSVDLGMSNALLSLGGNGASAQPANPFQDLKKEFNSSPLVKNLKVREYSDKDLQHIALSFEVDNFEKYLQNQPQGQGELAITLTRQPNGSVVFKQLTRLNAGDQPSGLDPKAMEPLFKDLYWTVTVHVPQVVSTNGTRLDDRTVQWKIPMADVFSGKAAGSLTLEYQPTGGSGNGPAGSLLGIGIAVLLVLALGGGAAYYFLVWRKRPTAVPAGANPGYPGFPPAGDLPPADDLPQAEDSSPILGQAAAEGVLSAPANEAGAADQPQPPETATVPPAQAEPVETSAAPAGTAAPRQYPAYPQYPQYPPAPPQGGQLPSQPGYYTSPAPRPAQPPPPADPPKS